MKLITAKLFWSNHTVLLTLYFHSNLFAAFETTVVTMLRTLNTKIDQQSGMLNQVLCYTRKAANIVEKPPGTPEFPLRMVEDFYSFEASLEHNTALRDYMVRIYLSEPYDF